MMSGKKKWTENMYTLILENVLGAVAGTKGCIYYLDL